MMRTIIFGSYGMAQHYAREESLSPGNWVHGSSRTRLMGLNPNEFHTVIIDGPLDSSAAEALREWNMRQRMYNKGEENAS